MKLFSSLIASSALIYSTMGMAQDLTAPSVNSDFYYAINISIKDIQGEKQSHFQQTQLICYTNHECENTIKNVYDDLVARAYTKGNEPKEQTPESEALKLKVNFTAENKATLFLETQYQPQSFDSTGVTSNQKQNREIDLPEGNGLIKNYHFSFDNAHNESRKDIDIKIVRIGT
jgi:hypothetical protein